MTAQQMLAFGPGAGGRGAGGTGATGGTGGEAERLARALLSRIAEPGDHEVAREVAEVGAAEFVARVRAGTTSYPRARHLRPRLATASAEDDMRQAADIGARFLIPGDPEWPACVDDLAFLDRADGAAPLGLWVRGAIDLAAVSGRSIAIVGARASTSYGEYVAGELGIGLAERGWAVVSGGAYGIDGTAHRGALTAEGVTVAVLACGVDVAYPRGHASLIERIATNGLVVSEWPPGCAPMRHRFLVRNRVIAALTAGTVVVEAATRSGALSTANRARELGRHVMAIPGPVTATMSAGTNALLREGDVACVTCAADVVELVGTMGDDLAAGSTSMGPSQPRDQLDEMSRRVLDAVPVRRPAGPASIAVAAGVEMRAVYQALGGLAARGFVERLDAGWRLARQGASS